MALTKIHTSLIDGDFSNIAVRNDDVDLGAGASITPNLSLSNFFTWTIDGNKTLNLPTANLGYGSWYILATNDATGGYTLGLDSSYNIVGGLTYDAAALKNNLISIVSNSTRYDVWFQSW